MAFNLEKYPTKSEIINYLRNKGYSQFFAEDVWVNQNKGYHDYNTIGTYEAYIRENNPDLKGDDLFKAVIKLDSVINEGKRLYIIGKTYNEKETLKSVYRAKWDPDKKLWWVRSQILADIDFNIFCINHNFMFRWGEED